ncbi:ankyrin repeat domain-containing protein [Nocardioides sp. Bht2]|uniref:ankyrin repeat domain-containing protein n=1 Tax=Nocardioides sp. Bht2 TaxID=3392297 RepID=UPI0039B54145
MSAGDWKALMDAIDSGDYDLVEFYAVVGVDVSYIHPEYQCTPLVTAILEDHAEIAMLLLEHGADPNQPSPLDEMNPLEAAEAMDQEQVVARLRELGAAQPEPPAEGPHQHTPRF